MYSGCLSWETWAPFSQPRVFSYLYSFRKRAHILVFTFEVGFILVCLRVYFSFIYDIPNLWPSSCIFKKYWFISFFFFRKWNFQGLKSSLPDYRAATYMIICQISVKVTMEETFVHSLATQTIKTLTKTPSLIKDGLGCLIVLLQRQKPESLGKKYVQVDWEILAIVTHQTSGKVKALCTCFFPGHFLTCVMFLTLSTYFMGFLKPTTLALFCVTCFPTLLSASSMILQVHDQMFCLQNIIKIWFSKNQISEMF